jgi:TonB family protein
MSYRALLFCPDEKTARTVTQVLGELEFAVEACLEPFAAVKKLMGEHFDAVVVDCDNEQNATLLFKSARNSTSNQASLAVAVVEGQAGVAKAFRIGANLVLTKPINIEQSKGTLRVARGLLRKGEPAKPGIPAATAAATTPAKPAAAKPAAPAKPAVASPTAAVSAARPSAPAVKPVAPLAKPAVASAPPAAPVETAPEISVMEEAAAPAAPAPRPVLGSHTASIDITSGFKPSASAASAPAFGGGAASAPAPARETESSSVAEISTKSAEADLFEKPADAVASEGTSSHSSNASFTFGGANLPVESSGGSKKILLGVVAAVIVVAGLYFGWSYFQGRSSQTTSIPATSAPAPVPTQPSPVSTESTAKPVSSAPKPASTTPAAATNSPNVQSALPAAAEDTQNIPDAVDDTLAQPSASTKISASASGAASKSAKSETAPLVVKGGSAPAVHGKPAPADTAAPSLIGMATPGAGAPPPNLVADSTKGPAPVLQTLNISQGVSQGLLIKKVQPIYPKNALAMHVEGAVELVATVSRSGNITAVKIVKGEPLLTKAASDAVKQWKYKPYELNGEPVEIQTQITVNFKLPH